MDFFLSVSHKTSTTVQHHPSPVDTDAMTPVLPCPDKLHVRTPHFPFVYRPDVERFAEQVYTYTTSLFLYPDTKSNPDDGPKISWTARDALEERRAQLEVLNEQLRINFLETEVLHLSLKRAEEVQKRLEGTRQEVKKDIEGQLENLEPTLRGNTGLPPELISRICEYHFMDADIEICSARFWSEELGDVIYKSAQFEMCFGDLCDLGPYKRAQWDRASRFTFDAWLNDDEYAGNILRAEDIPVIMTDNQWILQKRLHLVVRVNEGPTCRQELFGMLAICKDISLVMEKLIIGIYLHEKHLPFNNQNDPHECRGCTGKVVSKKCKVLVSPLHYLPCVGPLFACLQFLTLHHVTIPSPATPSARTFSSYFRTLDTTHLETLSICGSNGVGNYEQARQFFDKTPTLDMPNLTRLELDISELDSWFVILVLNCLEPTQLKTMIINDLFYHKTNNYEDVCTGLRNMLDILDKKCGHISKLAFHTPFEVVSDDNRNLMVVVLLDHLATVPESDDTESVVMFPELSHLTIPSNGGKLVNDRLVRLLTFRRHHAHPIHTLEVSQGPNDLSEDIDDLRAENTRLGLHVHNLVCNLSQFESGE